MLDGIRDTGDIADTYALEAAITGFNEQFVATETAEDE